MKLILSDDAVRMPYFRQNPESKISKRFAAGLIVIRSSGGLWRPEGKGYCVSTKDAGLFTLKDACAHTFHCGPEKHVVFLLEDKSGGDGELPVLQARKYYDERKAWGL